MNTHELILSPATPTRAPDWIDALAFRAIQIGKWEATGRDFWPRLANLTFQAVLLDRLSLKPGTNKRLWHAPLNPTDSFAVDHLAPRMLASNFVIADKDGRPDLDIEATKAVWKAAYLDLPDACCAPHLGTGDLRGRWFVRIAAAVAELVATQDAVPAEACHLRYSLLNLENRFLVSRLSTWRWPHGPHDKLRSTGEDFIQYVFGRGTTTAGIYALIFRSETCLHDGPRINWTFATWLRVGWDWGRRFGLASARKFLPEMATDQPGQDLAYTHDLLKILTLSAPEGVRWEHLGRACVAYIKERHGLVDDPHGPVLCLHALDYGFFMAVGVRGLLPASPHSSQIASR